MGFFSKDIETLEDLFTHGLQDIYYAENQILKTLPKLIDNASSPDLRKRLKRHLSETERQVSALSRFSKCARKSRKGRSATASMD
jgi:ferritin-like metal-binding protein YciE